MAKEDLLAEAARLGIEGLSEENTNREIQGAIDAHVAALESVTAPESLEIDQDASDGPESAAEAEPPEQGQKPDLGAGEPVYEIASLKPYCEALFGVGFHVIVGAVSAGCIPGGKATKSEVTVGIQRYLNSPVKG